MKRPRKRTIVRIALLVVVPVIALWSFPRMLAILLPTLSPFLGLTSALATRTVGVALVCALPMTALIFWRRRFFCRFLCPVGWVSETCGKISPQPWRGYMRLPRLGQGVALFTLGGALAALPFFLILDPLAMFTGAAGTTAYWAYGLCFAGVVLISLLFPGLWCGRLCPLGACQDLATDLKYLAGRKPSGKTGVTGDAGNVPRRIFLGVCGGAATAVLLARGRGRTHHACRVRPLRQLRTRMPGSHPPPGSDAARYQRTAVTCGAV